MVKYVNKISKEFIVDVEGIVSAPEKPIESTSHKVETQARKVFCISKAVAQLPLNLEDTARTCQPFTPCPAGMIATIAIHLMSLFEGRRLFQVASIYMMQSCLPSK